MNPIIGTRVFSEQERGRDFPKEPGYVWEWFKSSEQDVLQYLEYTPLDEEKENIGVWSPRLANLMVNVGGIIDSFCRYTVDSADFDNLQFQDSSTIADLRADPDDANMSHFRQMYEQAYGISGLELYVVPEGKQPVLTIQPFYSFANDTSPDWWSEVYNKLKHQRLSSSEYVKRATLDNVIKGLGGLFLLQLLHPPCQQYLLAQGVIRAMLPSWDSIEIRRNLKDHENWDEVEKIIAAKSGLFGFVYPTKKLEEEPINEETAETYGDHPEQLFSPKNPVSYETWQKVR